MAVLALSTPHSSNSTWFTAIKSSMLLLLRDAMKLQFHWKCTWLNSVF